MAKRIVRLSRFNYWLKEGINPLLDAAPVAGLSAAQLKKIGRADGLTVAEDAHRYLSDYYERKAKRAPAAIFDYARADDWAVKAPWVQAQFIEWRQRGDARSIRKFARACAGSPGQRTSATVLESIRRDQRAFRMMVNLRRKGETVEAIYHNSKLPDFARERQARRVWEEYNSAVGRYWKIPSGTPMKRIPWARVFKWLDQMNANLRRH